MKINLSLLLMILIVASCAPGKRLTNIESNISQLYIQGNYIEVLTEYDRLEIMARDANDTISQETTILAGKAAYHAEYFDQTHRYFDKTDLWKNNPEIVFLKGMSYQKTGNQEQEYQHWLDHIKLIEATENYRQVMLRLFEIEHSTGNYEAARNRWHQIPQNDDPEIMYKKLLVLENLNKNDEALRFAKKILNESPDYDPAKFWKAKYFYEKAENWYQDEMTKYNRNPNYTAYAYLRRELRLISADFRTSRDLFIQLHESNPQNLAYMQYLRHIYQRLEMRPEAARMNQLINELND